MKPAAILFAIAVAAPTTYTPARSTPARSTSAQPAARSWVTLKAATDQRRYTPGQPIQVRLTASNTHKRGAYLKFTSGQRFDFTVYRAGKNEAIYTWSAARMFIQSLGSLWLKPGQSQNYEATVGDEMGDLKPGKYRLQARLANSPRPIIAKPIEFEVTDLALSMTARTDKTSYKIGEPVQIEVAVANRANRENRIRFNSGMTYDVFISDEAGKPVWNYGANLRFIQVLGEVLWKKGETKSYSTTWDGIALSDDKIAAALKHRPGRYRVQAVLQSTPQLYAAPIYIDITE